MLDKKGYKKIYFFFTYMYRYLKSSIKRLYPTGTKAGTWTCFIDAERTDDGITGELRELQMVLVPNQTEYKAETYFKPNKEDHPFKVQVGIEDVPFSIIETIKLFFTTVVIKDTENWQRGVSGNIYYYHPSFGKVNIFDRAKCSQTSTKVYFHIS